MQARLDSLTIHPALDALPMPTDDDTAVRAVMASVCDLGRILEPLKVCKGRVVDGRIRMRGARKAGLEAVTVEEVAEGEVVSIIVHSFAARRHCTKSALALLLESFFTPLLAEANARRVACLKRGTKRTPAEALATGATQEEIAEHFGICEWNLRAARRVKAKFVANGVLRDLFEAKILAGEMNLSAALQGIAGYEATAGKSKTVQGELALWDGKIKGFCDPRRFSTFAAASATTQEFVAATIAEAVCKNWPDAVKEKVFDSLKAERRQPR